MATSTVVGSTPTPSRPHEGLANTPAAAFRTAHEESWLSGANEDNPAALIVNPTATPAALDAAIRSRAESLAVLLDFLEGVDEAGHDLSQLKVFTPLAALADEVRILASAIQTARGRHV